jgi:hypothetical protein
MASAFLHRTMDRTADSGYAKKWVCSTWLKISKLGVLENKGLFSIQKGSTSNSRVNVGFNSTDNLWVETKDSTGNDDAFKQTKMKFRDTGAWYHIYIKYDSTLGTAADRLVIFVNGVEQTYDNVNEVGSNFGILMDSSVDFRVGIYRTNGGNIRYMDGQYAHFHFINYEDGATPDPYTDFGETDATTGIWKPKTSPSVTYGDQSVFLKFDNSANMGLDSSGQSNNLTTSGTIIQTKDTPSNVFCTMNALNSNPNITYTQVNNTVNADGGGDLRTAVSTLGATSGKYYAEAKVVSIQDAIHVGLVAADSFAALGSNNYGWAIHQFQNSLNYMSVGKIKNYNNNTVATGLPTYGANDIIGIAADLDNSKIYFHKNGTYINSGVPTSGSTGTGAYALTANTTYLFGSSTNYTNGKVSWNFGNGYFGTTAVSSAQSPDDGNGIFEYDVPAGYRALCTKSINAEEYS